MASEKQVVIVPTHPNTYTDSELFWENWENLTQYRITPLIGILHYCSLLWTWSGFDPSIFWPSLGCGLGIEDHSKKSRLTIDLLPKDWSSVMPFNLVWHQMIHLWTGTWDASGTFMQEFCCETVWSVLWMHFFVFCFSPSFVHVHTLSTWKRIMTSLQAHPFMCASLRYRTFVRWSRLWTLRIATGKLDGMYVTHFSRISMLLLEFAWYITTNSHRLSGLYPITNGHL